MTDRTAKEIRNVALVGPYASGKTTFLESVLWVTQTLTRKGSVKEGNTVSDSVPEARDRQMSVEMSVATAIHGGLQFNFLDCPGSIEFAQETYNALVGAGAAIVVCEPILERVQTLAPLLKFLDDWQIPHLIFLNKMDRLQADYGAILAALKGISSRPLVPQQYPIQRDRQVVGYIDLVTEQAYQYHSGAAADPIPLPPELQEEEAITREEMLETLAEFDDHLLEALLENIPPSTAEILQDLKKELTADQIVPVFLGMAEQDFGVRPLLDALVKEAPEPQDTAERRGLVTEGQSGAIAQVLKTYFTPQGGRLSLLRIWQGEITDGMNLNGLRVGGLYRLMGSQQENLSTAGAGDLVAVGRLDGVDTGETLWGEGVLAESLPKAPLLKPVYALAIAPTNRKDEVKLSAALGKLIAEDPAYAWEQQEDTHEILLWGQGEIHLQVALDRLKRKYNLPMTTSLPQIPYKETIRKATSSHGRYKHQTGGHGAFGDVHLTLQPLDRGAGFHFNETIVGGVVPKQYIPGVEMGVREYLHKGALGFPVVDLAVTLTDGSYHSVDSSEQAFKQAARIAMAEGMPKGDPQLLEPILQIAVSLPNEYTAKGLQLVSGRRGQILGYEPIANWQGWDRITAYLPQGEMQDFIIELRSGTMGVGFFDWEYDHLQEVPDRLVPPILERYAS